MYICYLCVYLAIIFLKKFAAGVEDYPWANNVKEEEQDASEMAVNEESVSDELREELESKIWSLANNIAKHAAVSTQSGFFSGVLQLITLIPDSIVPEFKNAIHQLWQKHFCPRWKQRHISLISIAVPHK